ncbi:uncharacterized protein EAF02_008659 [Botrytis sinoallii]|uniref:uncharacterized protein n=1 Tax=Botrytis sinoallii TaxID=1463999 RepID=UPI00190269AC|nr:uncharacterized protein EAF02_008659 [Botrytis sinoallii]KAF7874682.1 hypothetical protein EAF02_008659 [Botrytis sinoallii]
MHAPRMTPLSASVFFAGGHHASKRRRTMTPYQNYDESLDQFRVIDAHILGNTWPRGIWMVLVGDTYDLLSNHPQVNQNQSVKGALSLQILAETKLFNELHLQTPANFRRLLDRASVMPRFFPTAISKSREKPLRLSRYYNSRELLGEALMTQSVIDLGYPYNLSSGHVLQILEKVMSSMNRGNVTALSLCGNNLISPAALETILAALPNLKDVYLLNTPGIPLGRKMEILQGTKVSGFHDSELYSMAFKPATGSLGYNKIEPPHFLVSQVIYALSSDGKIPGLIARKTKDSWPFEESVYVLSLREVNLTLPFLINGFANFLRVLSNPDTDRKQVSHGTRILAKTMAISEMNDEMKIAPIAKNLFEFNLTRNKEEGDCWMNYYRQRPRATPSGKWNLIVVSQPYEPFPGAAKHSFRHRYAFIKAKEHGAHVEANAGQECTGSVAFVKSYEPQLVVADIDQFLQQAVTGEEDEMIIKQARDFWKKGTGLLDLQRCSEAEVEAIVKEAKLSFGIKEDNGMVMLKVFGQETG